MSYKRTIFLINPKFQIKFSLYICILIGVSSLIYPYTIYHLLINFSEFLAKTDPAMAAKLSAKRSDVLIILGLWQAGFVALTFLAGIFFSHKIAGPIYKLKKFLTGIRDGASHGKLYFRKGDYFQDVAEDYNEAFFALEEEHKKDMVYLGEVNSYINNLALTVPDDKKIILTEITRRLTDIQSRYNEK